MIDRSSTSQNVYLLSQVDENDLKEFVDQEKETATVTPTPQVVIDENKTEETGKKEEITGSAEKGGRCHKRIWEQWQQSLFLR